MVAEEYGFVPLESSIAKGAEGAAKEGERTQAGPAEPAPGFDAAFAAAGLLALALVSLKRRS
jgi:MYXO-CTERM domain-containing protein